MYENSTYSFAVNGDGGPDWRWRVMDDSGATRVSGVERSQEAALRTAMFAAAAADSLTRVRARDDRRVRAHG